LVPAKKRLLDEVVEVVLLLLELLLLFEGLFLHFLLLFSDDLVSLDLIQDLIFTEIARLRGFHGLGASLRLLCLAARVLGDVLYLGRVLHYVYLVGSDAEIDGLQARLDKLVKEVLLLPLLRGLDLVLVEEDHEVLAVAVLALGLLLRVLLPVVLLTSWRFDGILEAFRVTAAGKEFVIDVHLSDNVENVVFVDAAI
jgi:hypothetical protein